jgi:hypothetical protein
MFALTRRLRPLLNPTPRRQRSRRPPRRSRPAVEVLERRVTPSTFTGNRTADDTSSGSLRWAIQQANSNSGPDTIAFQIPGAGVHTIQPTAPLPVITDPLLLDGWSQPGFAGAPLIELDGSLAGQGTSGLVITAGNTTVQGLVINRFSHWGVELRGVSNGVVQGNYVGTDATGTLARGNGWAGVFLHGGARSNRVGTNGDGVNDAAERNVLSGNFYEGVALTDSGTNGNLVAGNFIGTDVTGTKPLGSQTVGVDIFGVNIPAGPQGNVIGGGPALGNVIAFNRGQGVAVQGATTAGNSIRANSIFDNEGLGIDLGGGRRHAQPPRRPGRRPQQPPELPGDPVGHPRCDDRGERHAERRSPHDAHARFLRQRRPDDHLHGGRAALPRLGHRDDGRLRQRRLLGELPRGDGGERIAHGHRHGPGGRHVGVLGRLPADGVGQGQPVPVDAHRPGPSPAEHPLLFPPGLRGDHPRRRCRPDQPRHDLHRHL